MRRLMVAGVLIVTATFGVAVPSSAAAPSKKVVPKACLRALDAAEDMAGVSAEFTSAVGQYLSDLHDATLALTPDTSGMVEFLNMQTDALVDLNATMERLTPQIQEAGGRYRTNAAKCRAKA